MDFGIMAMQLELITQGIQPGAPQALNLTSFQHEELIRTIAEAGFNTIELGGDLSIFLPHTFAPSAISALLSLKEELGLNFTVHLPLWSVEPSTPLTSVRNGSIKAVIDIIHATRVLSPRVYVLHATGALAAEFYRMKLPHALKELLLRQFQINAATSIREILETTRIDSKQLAVETIEFPLEFTLQLASDLDLGICLDTGHILAGFSGRWELEQALEICLPRLQEIHLHDAPRFSRSGTIGYGTDHQALGSGDLAIGHLLNRLEEAGFAGPVIFELSIQEALSSLEIIRSIRPDLIHTSLQNRI